MEQFLQQASTYAADIDWLFWLITAIVGFWFFVAQGVFFGFLIKYRRKPGEKAGYVEGKSKEEKKWITIPHFLIILCDIVILVGAVKVWNRVKLDMPPADATIRVQARQWAWIFQHPGSDGKLDTSDDIRTTDELHLLNNTTYHFELTAKDVLHSFSIPVFRLKQDAVPGRTIRGWFKTQAVGEFDIQCAEMCGIGHGLMAAKLFIEREDAHASWMSTAPRAGNNPPLLASK
jgi:cytochrome c oxidase subunit 2